MPQDSRAPSTACPADAARVAALVREYHENGCFRLSVQELFGMDGPAFARTYVPKYRAFKDVVDALADVPATATPGAERGPEAADTTRHAVDGNPHCPLPPGGLNSVLASLRGRDHADADPENDSAAPGARPPAARTGTDVGAAAAGGRDAAVASGHDTATACDYAQWCELRFKSHLLLPWLRDLLLERVTPVVRAAVQAALGTDDTVIWSTDWCVKPPSSDARFSWHQDGTYSGYTHATGVTLWVAFSEVVDPESGPVVFKQGSHKLGQCWHYENKDDAGNLLAFGQTLPGVDFKEYVDAKLSPEQRGWPALPSISHALSPGDATVHGFWTVHQSQPNTLPYPRVGLAVRFVRADTGAALRRADCVTCFTGVLPDDAWYTREPAAVGCESRDATCFSAADVRAWRRSVDQEKAGYFAGAAGVRQYKG